MSECKETWSVRTHPVEASVRRTRLPQRHVLGVSTELSFFFLAPVSRACEAETSGWECRTQRRAGWAGVEEQREGGASWWEGRQSGGMKKKHQVTVYIPLRSHVAQTQERQLCSGAQSTSRCCTSAHFENVIKKEWNRIQAELRISPSADAASHHFSCISFTSQCLTQHFSVNSRRLSFCKHVSSSVNALCSFPLAQTGSSLQS